MGLIPKQNQKYYQERPTQVGRHAQFNPYQNSVLDTEIPQADYTRSSTQLQLSHYNEWE